MNGKRVATDASSLTRAGSTHLLVALRGHPLLLSHQHAHALLEDGVLKLANVRDELFHAAGRATERHKNEVKEIKSKKLQNARRRAQRACHALLNVK